MGDNRPAVYEEGDKWVLRASSLGNCFSHLVRCGLGYTPEPPPDFMLERFAEGDRAEPVILNWLNTKGGWAIWDAYKMDQIAEQFGGSVAEREGADPQLELEIPVGKNAVIRVHPDGIATCFMLSRETQERWPNLQTGEEVVVEVKALGKDFLKKYKREGLNAFPYYAYQVSIEMAATGLPCLFVVGEKDENGDVQEDKIVWDLYREPPYTLPQLKVRVMKILAAINRGEIPECDIAMYPCGFWQEHDTTSKDSVWYKPPVSLLNTDNSDVDVPSVTKWAEVYRQTLDAETKLKETKTEAVRELVKLFDEAGARGSTVDCGDFIVEDYIGESKGRVDYKKLFKDKGITDEEADKYRSETRTLRYPKVKEKKDKG